MSKYFRYIVVIGTYYLFFFTYSVFPQVTFQLLEGRPGGSGGVTVYGVSADGSTVVGNDYNGTVFNPEAIRWTAGTGTVALGFLPGGLASIAFAVSSNGSVIVGYGTNGLGQQEAFRWTAGTGMVGLGFLPGAINSIAYGVSSDGSVIVGRSTNAANVTEAFKWTQADGMVGLGDLPGGVSFSVAEGVSSDGSVVVGNSHSENGFEAFRWTEGSGMIGLGDLPGGIFDSDAHGISADGSAIVGESVYSSTLEEAFISTGSGMVGLGFMQGGVISKAFDVSSDGSVVVGIGYSGLSGGTAFVWTAEIGMINLQWLLAQYGIDALVNDARGVSDNGTVIVGGTIQNGFGWRAVFPDGFQLPFVELTSPHVNEMWIAGEPDTIRWSGGYEGQFLNIEFSSDNGNTYSLITIGIAADSGYYIWNIPQNILSTKVKIKISDFADSTTFVVSDIFKIKGYVLTKYLPNGDYLPYTILSDSWGFANYSSDEWPASWYNRFNYQGIDPFTNSQYSQWQGNFVFASSLSSEHPDWTSFVNTFGTSACYISTNLGIYSPAALSYWESKKDSWNGSCFGIAISNFLAWENKTIFLNRYPNFPNFVNPSTVFSDTNTIPVINELFTHQFGNPHRNYRANVGLNKTPTQTLNDLKQMLITDGAPVQTLSFLNNNGTGGHAILSYKVKKDASNPNIFYAYVYDNSYPDSINAQIVFNTTVNGGNGSWSYSNWPGWGGNKWIYLRDPVSNYLTNPTIDKAVGQESPFILDGNELQICPSIDASTIIKDENGNVTGYFNGEIHTNIPNSSPLVVDNGSETPPYGYELPASNYSIAMNNFTTDTIKVFFFTGNKTFSYKRTSADLTETDNLYLNDGMSVSNHDDHPKTVSLLNILNETTQEKLFAIRSIELNQNDSVKIENLDDDKLKLISYGSTRDYDIELNFVSENILGRFGDFNIPLDANTSHTLVPDWSDLTNTELTILVDIGNDGTIDDTLSLINQVTGIGDDQGSLIIPNSYNLAQNFPNPFNPVTTIKYSIPKSSLVVLKIYDVLGNEIATLVNEEKERGVYTSTFDASGLASGLYLYRLQAGSFVETKKMMLLK